MEKGLPFESGTGLTNVTREPRGIRGLEHWWNYHTKWSKLSQCTLLFHPSGDPWSG